MDQETKNELSELLTVALKNVLTKNDLTSFRDDLKDLKGEVSGFKSEMVTKDDLASLKGEVAGLKSKMATKDDLANLESKMATKDDLESMATKDDLTNLENRMATKDELASIKSKMATKDDLTKLATRKELENLALMVKKGFDKTATKQELKESEKKLRAEINKSELGLKDFIENRLADQKGDLVLLARKEDKKLLHLAGVLYGRKVINKSEVKELSSMEPFPRIAV